MGRAILCRLFYGYLKCLEKTVKVEWIQPEMFGGNSLVGFWHEDSFAMNLVLREITGQGEAVAVLVTGDVRGNYIQYLLEKCKGRAVRVGHGFCNAGVLKDILKSLKEDRESVAIAMDGPLGPRHIPKKMTYFLSEQGRRPMVGVTLDYSHKIALKSRWDHYRIPLPFSRITVRFDNYGVVTSHHKPEVRVSVWEHPSIQALGQAYSVH